MNAYIDASVLLRLSLGQAGRLEDWTRFESKVTSDLTEVECLRTLDRLRLQGTLPEDGLVRSRQTIFFLLETCDRIALDPRVLRRAAESFPVVLGTLDALHLASAILWQERCGGGVVMATHDDALGQAARALGMPAAGL